MKGRNNATIHAVKGLTIQLSALSWSIFLQLVPVSR